MKKKLPGIITLTAASIFLLLALFILISGENFRAFNLQLTGVFFVFTLAGAGHYSLIKYAPQSRPVFRNLIIVFGYLLVLFSAPIAFNIVDFLTTYNWLVCGIILYVTLVQLQLLRWGKQQPLLPRIASFGLLAANLFLIIYFIAVWRYSAIGLWIDIAVLVSLVTFVIGLISLPRSKAEPTTEPAANYYAAQDNQ